MTLFEKIEVLKDAGFAATDSVCDDVQCDECPIKEITECQMMLAVQKLIKAGYDIVIQ